MTKIVDFKGVNVEVTDKGVTLGSKFPNFKAVTKELEDFDFSSLEGKIVVLNTFPSIDTGVCALQTIKFNTSVKDFQDVVVVTVSKDLPFALARFCGEKGISNAITVSDFKYRDFENNVGGFIPEVGLFARQVFVLDKDGVVKYNELVSPVGTEPDYDKALELVKELLEN